MYLCSACEGQRCRQIPGAEGTGNCVPPDKGPSLGSDSGPLKDLPERLAPSLQPSSHFILICCPVPLSFQSPRPISFACPKCPFYITSSPTKITSSSLTVSFLVYLTHIFIYVWTNEDVCVSLLKMNTHTYTPSSLSICKRGNGFGSFDCGLLFFIAISSFIHFSTNALISLHLDNVPVFTFSVSVHLFILLVP